MYYFPQKKCGNNHVMKIISPGFMVLCFPRTSKEPNSQQYLFDIWDLPVFLTNFLPWMLSLFFFFIKLHKFLGIISLLYLDLCDHLSTHCCIPIQCYSLFTCKRLSEWGNGESIRNMTSWQSRLERWLLETRVQEQHCLLWPSSAVPFVVVLGTWFLLSGLEPKEVVHGKGAA